MMKRRRILQLGALGAGVSGLSWLAYRYIPPAPSDNLSTVSSITSALFDSFDAETRDTVVVEFDHPLRQYHNRGVWAGGQPIGLGDFSRKQLSLISDLMYAGLSSTGRNIVPNQYYMKWPNIMINNLLICGDPHTDRCQVIFSGPHLNLRVGGRSQEGVAFGGPQVYGDQRGNKETGLPGNQYQAQLNAGMALFHSLDKNHQTAVLLEKSPIQTQIELQGSKGEFEGVSVASLTSNSREKVRHLVNLILRPYPERDVSYTWECLNHNGGIDALHLSYYQDSTYKNGGPYQTFRLEGPAAVFYFRGYPHVHAFFNVAMNGDAPLSVGEVIARNPGVMEGENLKNLFEKAMLASEKTDFSFYNLDSVVGKLRAGEIRTGDIYNAESWQNRVVQVEVNGSELSGELLDQLESKGVHVDPARMYKIATTDYVEANKMTTSFGSVTKIKEGRLLRDQVISYLMEHDFI